MSGGWSIKGSNDCLLASVHPPPTPYLPPAPYPAPPSPHLVEHLCNPPPPTQPVDDIDKIIDNSAADHIGGGLSAGAGGGGGGGGGGGVGGGAGVGAAAAALRIFALLQASGWVLDCCLFVSVLLCLSRF